MLDIPMFTTENGAASLILKEIPYSEAAYIKIHSSQAPEALLEECVSFCRMAGAENIYASGHVILEKYPFHTAILEMCCPVGSIPETDAALFPLQDKTLEIWRELYNRRMKNVPNFSFMSVLDGKKLIAKGGGYFVHKSGELLGIGIAVMIASMQLLLLCREKGKLLCGRFVLFCPLTQQFWKLLPPMKEL